MRSQTFNIIVNTGLYFLTTLIIPRSNYFAVNLSHYGV